jgi:hypothetical protein
MYKTISAALLAVSVLAAPALAATTGKTNEAATTTAPQVKSDLQKSKAKISHRHHKHHRHLSSIKTNKKMGAIKTHKKIGAMKANSAIKANAKVSSKHAVPVTKRG